MTKIKGFLPESTIKIQKIRQAVIHKTMGYEGGYVDNPDDNGGKTKYGITERTAKANGYMGRMTELTPKEARKIYRNAYWDSVSLSEITLLCKGNTILVAKLFDAGVNHGTVQASKFFQRALNYASKKDKLGDLKVDGKIGEQSLWRLKILIDKEGSKILGAIKMLIVGQQVDFYNKLVAKNHSQAQFLKGWLLRLMK